MWPVNIRPSSACAAFRCGTVGAGEGGGGGGGERERGEQGKVHETLHCLIVMSSSNKADSISAMGFAGFLSGVRVSQS